LKGSVRIQLRHGVRPQIAARESPRAAKPRGRTTDQVSLDDIERIVI
jgi:hypothetical protein